MTPWTRTRRLAGWVVGVLCSLLLCGAPAHAHLIAAQKGTLNLVGDAAFLVLSVPVSAFQGVDDDGDAALSKAELQVHAQSIRAQLLAGVQLLGPGGAVPLQLVMVDIAETETLATQLTVLGRFTLQPVGSAGGVGGSALTGGLSLRFTLFGTQDGEGQQDLTITRQDDTQWLRFTPWATTHALLPGTFAVLVEYFYSGAVHVLGGADHLLFLLVVLVSGWGWRSLPLVLTCFTMGHAISLGVCVWGGFTVPSRIVEPAIAATVVSMAAFDGWGRWRGRPWPTPLRLVLVFACALVHGLGFADALSGLTQWPLGSRPMLWALAGFNLGVESAQVMVAVAAGGLWWVLGRLAGPRPQGRANQLATWGAMAAGSFWLAERLLLRS